MKTSKIEELISLAKKACSNAYAPYSKFNVGAALLTKNGKIFTGSNIENASYGATVCAERVAIFKAVSEGEREFESIAIYTNADKLSFPCGICRQVMIEFSKDLIIILSNEKEKKIYTLKEILPYPFTNEDL
ncbi:MAG TPA: cytidine deaminase [Caldisericia bacterium]|jgi:cytidine deaminase|nr:cytidine deaminase [Caldisericia bacterium]NLI55958.1 cytidine deaminase [bacterium]HOC53126.1 cytidine deaminase [Caldisericia bacterium]HPB34297.1 cytidine deaminase [Caldisericia bacterium]HQJ57114.1 cytidine deaminase [Caldisericia bacterium]